MKFKGCTSKLNAHGRSQISALIINQVNPTEIVSIAQDGFIKKWDFNTLGLLNSLRIKTAYLTSLINFNKGFLVGNGKGQLLRLSNSLKLQWSKKIHSDCITDIIQTYSYLITIGFDGKILFLNKQTFREDKQINLQVPLLRIIKIQDSLYVSANPGFKIKLQNLQVVKIQRSQMIIKFENKILNCSEVKGFGILNSTEQFFEQIPCHFMLPFNNKIIAISEGNIGQIDFNKNKQLQGENHFGYKCYRTVQLKQGYSIKTGQIIQNCIILGGQDGMIYKFQWEL